MRPESTADEQRFSIRRGGLEDLTEWIQRLLHADQGEQQNRNALHWAARTVDELANVEATLRRIAAHGLLR